MQASQLSLDGSGIGTFSDRARDAVRGGGAGDSGAALSPRRATSTAWSTRPTPAPARSAPTCCRPPTWCASAWPARCATTAATADGATRALSAIDYKGQPAGYAAQPGEVVNYVENHDNQTLFDINALQAAARHAAATIARACSCSARRSIAFSQGVAYFHAGIDVLRSKSLDRNSFDSGDWFNRLDWTSRQLLRHRPAAGADNGRTTTRCAAAGRRARISPPADIAWMRDAFRDLLRIRASSTLFRLRTRDDVQARLTLPNTGPPRS